MDSLETVCTHRVLVPRYRIISFGPLAHTSCLFESSCADDVLTCARKIVPEPVPEGGHLLGAQLVPVARPPHAPSWPHAHTLSAQSGLTALSCSTGLRSMCSFFREGSGSPNALDRAAATYVGPLRPSSSEYRFCMPPSYAAKQGTVWTRRYDVSGVAFPASLSVLLTFFLGLVRVARRPKGSPCERR